MIVPSHWMPPVCSLFNARHQKTIALPAMKSSVSHQLCPFWWCGPDGGTNRASCRTPLRHLPWVTTTGCSRSSCGGSKLSRDTLSSSSCSSLPGSVLLFYRTVPSSMQNTQNARFPICAIHLSKLQNILCQYAANCCT